MADTIPAMLEPGEYVLNRNAAKAIGKKKLDELNYEEAPREGYQYGGSILGSLLSRAQKKDEGPVYPKPDFTIPAGKNIFGQPTEKMDTKDTSEALEEFMEMFMPGGGAMGAVKKGAGVLKEGVGAMKFGKAGIEKFMSKPTRREGLDAMGKFMTTGKGQKEILKSAELETMLEELQRWSTYKGLFEQIIKKQKGGSIDDFSLMDYMMPAMDKRLGPSLKKFQYGGAVRGGTQSNDPYNQYSQQQQQSYIPGVALAQSALGTTQDPKYTGYMTSFANAPTGAQPEPSSQSLLAQPSGSMSTGIESIFQEAGYETPGADYLEGLQAYDPTKQQRLQEDYSSKLPGPVGVGGGFAKEGASGVKAQKQREMVTEQYQRGSEDLRTQYREDIMAQIAEDIASGTYEFDELG